MSTILKIDPSAAPKMLAAAVSPKNAYEDGKPSGAQATDRQTGAPLWRVSVFVMDADSQHAPETVSVTVPAQVAPALPALSPIRFVGLRVMMWSGGAALRADAVEAVAPDAASTSSSSSSSFLSDIEGGE